MSLSEIGAGRNYLPPEEDPHTCGTSERTKLKIIILTGALEVVGGLGMMVAATQENFALAMGGFGLLGSGIITYIGGFTWYCRRDICYIRREQRDEELGEIQVVADQVLRPGQGGRSQEKSAA